MFSTSFGNKIVDIEEIIMARQGEYTGRSDVNEEVTVRMWMAVHTNPMGLLFLTSSLIFSPNTNQWIVKTINSYCIFASNLWLNKQNRNIKKLWINEWMITKWIYCNICLYIVIKRTDKMSNQINQWMNNNRINIHCNIYVNRLWLNENNELNWTNKQLN